MEGKNSRKTGRIYEDKAAEYLKGKGYRILEQNFRVRTGEIDIIALEGETIVFVEVKYRENGGLGGPLEAVTPNKQRRISRTALYYCACHGAGDRECRFDVIGFFGAGRMEHIKNAFDFCG